MLAHRLAKLSAVATFVMLIIGGTINTTGSSLACEASFGTCKGEVFPEMTGGVLYEHGHRLAGIVIGLLQIALTVTLWRRRRDLRQKTDAARQGPHVVDEANAGQECGADQ